MGVLEGLREMFTIGGRFSLIRHDADGNPRMRAGAYPIIIAANAMLALLARLAYPRLNS